MGLGYFETQTSHYIAILSGSTNSVNIYSIAYD